jgi:DNA repair protein RecO (recombination protein O)
MSVAGQALRWLREASALRSPEPALWLEIENFLDSLDRSDLASEPETLLVSCGLSILRVLGFGLELENCVRCGRRCEHGRSAFVDPVQGGLVCRACGGGSILIPGAMRDALLQGQGVPDSMTPAERDAALRLVDGALLAHVGIGA